MSSINAGRIGATNRETLRAVVYHKEGEWVAHCVDLDIVSTGPTQAQAGRHLVEAVTAQREYAQQDGQEIAMGPLLLLGARGQLAIDAGRVGQVQPLAEGFDGNLGRRQGGQRGGRGHPAGRVPPATSWGPEGTCARGALQVAGLARYGSTRSICTLRRVRADSIIASVTSTTRSPSRPVAAGWPPVATARWKSSISAA